MKKSYLIVAMLAMAICANAQLKIGANVGVPVGDLSEFYDVSLGADLYYLTGKPDGRLSFGGGAGYMTYAGAETPVGRLDGSSYLTFAGAARVKILFLTVGPDLGYGFALSEDRTGGFHWRAVAGIKLLIFEFNLFYHSVANDVVNQNTLGFGALLVF
jgi:hypothetical protein